MAEDQHFRLQRGRIEAVIGNARCAEAMLDHEGSLAAFVRTCGPDPAEVPEPQAVFAFMQAMGLINDHAGDCVIRSLQDQDQDQEPA